MLIQKSYFQFFSSSYGSCHMHSRLDYCNGALAGLPQYQLNKLQSILRASARLVQLLPGRASVSSLMRVRLHWLPFPQRIKFKLCSTVYKCLHDAAPAYLSEFCVPLSSQAGHSQLCSAAAGDLLIPPTRTVTIGGRCFSVAGPVAWNSLPTDLKDSTLTFPVFKKLLKTHLFVTIWTAALRFCDDCMKGALQVPVSIQFNSICSSWPMTKGCWAPSPMSTHVSLDHSCPHFPWPWLPMFSLTTSSRASMFPWTMGSGTHVSLDHRHPCSHLHIHLTIIGTVLFRQCRVLAFIVYFSSIFQHTLDTSSLNLSFDMTRSTWSLP